MCWRTHPKGDVEGGWPHWLVREGIERSRGDALQRGCAPSGSTLRGATMRGMLNGGQQERDLAADYGLCGSCPALAAHGGPFLGKPPTTK